MGSGVAQGQSCTRTMAHVGLFAGDVTRVWQVPRGAGDGAEADEVQLYHHTVSGRCNVSVNGSEAVTTESSIFKVSVRLGVGGRLLDLTVVSSNTHTTVHRATNQNTDIKFKVNDVDAVLEVVGMGSRYKYKLSVDGKPVQEENDKLVKPPSKVRASSNNSWRDTIGAL